MQAQTEDIAAAPLPAVPDRSLAALERLREVYRQDPVRGHALLVENDPNHLRRRLDAALVPLRHPVEGLFGEQYEINLNDHIGWNIFMRGYFDTAPIACGLFFSRTRAAGTFVDVGANIGSAAIPLAVLGVDVVAVEGSVSVAAELSRNVALNSPLPYTVVNLAVTSPEHADQDKRATIFLPDGNVGAGSLISTWNRSRTASRTELVRLTTLDRIVEHLGIDRVQCAKIDVEGFEYEALLGFRECLRTQRFPVLFEWRPDGMRRSDVPVKNIMATLPEDYVCFAVRSGIVPHPQQPSQRLVTIRLDDFHLEGLYENVMALPRAEFVASPYFATMRDGGLSFVI